MMSKHYPFVQTPADADALAHAVAPFDIGEAQRNQPDAAFIEQMRARFPTEREIDAMLTRKMQRRSGPPFRGLTLTQISACLIEFLRAHLDRPFEITDQRWLAGGASKIQMGFTLHSPAASSAARSERYAQTRLVIRMEPSESMNSTSRLREFQMLKAFSGTLRVPEVYWIDEHGSWFPEPALIYAFAPGVTKPRTLQGGQISGTGTNFGPELRRRLAPQFVDVLAKIHRFDYSGAELSAFNQPSVGSSDTNLWQLNRVRRVWEEDRGEDIPLVEVAANWLLRNLPVLNEVSVVHGDYRSGNFLFDESDGQITSVLDWERASLGDRHRDLAWAAAYPFGHFAEDHKTFLVCGLLPSEEFFERYEKASGFTLDPKRLRYFEIFNCYQLVVSTIATGYRVVRLGKSHQDIVLAWAGAAGYSFAEPLRRALEEVL
jgi:aminoglycoside phosphotransferase (APT) family kinase protein